MNTHQTHEQQIYRVVQRGCIRLHGKYYWSTELEAYDGKAVKVLPNQDHSRIDVFFQDKFICSTSCTG